MTTNIAKPKFSQIKQFICQQIESGAWPEHEKVPSENVLAQQFSVSRMTARRALQELTEQGILVRTQGAGTFVATFKSQSSLLEIQNIAEEIAARGHQHSAKTIVLEQVEVTPEIAIQLNVKPQTNVYFSLILHSENSQPIQLEARYVNPLLVPNYLQQDFTQTTPHEYLSQEAPLTEATHEVQAILPTVQQAEFLQIASSQPCLQVKRRTWSTQGVVSFAILTSPGDKYRLGGHLIF